MAIFENITTRILADTSQTASFRAIEYDYPESKLGWFCLIGGFVLVFLVTLYIYFKDTNSISRLWRIPLLSFRILVICALLIIALNPHERVQKRSDRPSRVALLVDTSLSMNEPLTANEPDSSASQNDKRIDAIKDKLNGSPVLKQLREQHDVSIYTFDSRLKGPHVVFPKLKNGESNSESETIQKDSESAQPEKPEKEIASTEWNSFLNADGLETRLGESLLELIHQISGRTLSGIAILTDGGANSGIQPSTAHDVARESKIRLISVGIGSHEKPVNLKVSKFQAPSDVQMGESFDLSAFVQGEGLVGEKVEVQLLVKPDDDNKAKPTLLEKKVVDLKDEAPVELKFQQKSSVAGDLEYSMQVKVLNSKKESNLSDNQIRKTIHILDRKTQVLMIAGGPMRDYRFVRNMLFRHSTVNLDVWLQTVEPSTIGQVSQESNNLLSNFPETAAKLFNYDVIIAFDADWLKVKKEQRDLIQEWVSEHSGGLILVAGEIYTSQVVENKEELEGIHHLYPVILRRSLGEFRVADDVNQPWPLELTAEGKEASLLQLNENKESPKSVWDQMAGFYRCYPTGGAKAGAVVYSYFSNHRTINDQGKPILMASQFYGSGRVFYLGSPEMWRLRFLGEEYYDRFWTKVIRDVSQGRLQRGHQRGILLLERDQYFLGQTVRIRTQLLSPQMKPLEMNQVKTEIITPSGKPLFPVRNLLKDKNRPGQYQGDFRANQTGTYRLRIPIPDSNDALETKIDVIIPALEMENSQQNIRLLTDLSRDTGGKYLSFADFETQIPKLFPNKSEQILVDERIETLWDRKWVLYVLVMFLAIEWIIRKWLKLA